MADEKKREFTPKQRRFIAEYLVDLNATQAAIRAGYSTRTAGFIGSENLKKPQISAAIAAKTAKQLDRVEITVDEVLRELMRLGMSDVRDLIGDDGNLLPPDQWPDGAAHCISSIESERNPKTGSTVTKVKLWDKSKNLENLGRYLKMFVDRSEQTGANGSPLYPTYADVVSELRRRREKKDGEPK